MPALVENPAEFNKQRLKWELVPHSVELPPADSDNQVCLELHMKQGGNKNTADFSSDEEEQVRNGTVS